MERGLPAVGFAARAPREEVRQRVSGIKTHRPGWKEGETRTPSTVPRVPMEAFGCRIIVAKDPLWKAWLDGSETSYKEGV
jgi:hypothetical protein